MKKTLTIFLLSIFAYNAGGFLLFFNIQQSQIRKEVKRQIKTGVPDSDLRLIVLNNQTKNKIDWKNKNEFSFEGTMFDIVKRSINKNGDSLLYCITDDQETKLFAGLNEQVEKNTDSRKNEKNAFANFFKLFSNVYLISEYNLNLCHLEVNKNMDYSFIYLAPLIEIQSPPPKML